MSANEITQPIYFVEIQFQSDKDFYYRFFTEIFLYLGQNKPKKEWRAVPVFYQHRLDPGIPIEYQCLLASQQVQWVYLDELRETANQSLGVGIVQLVVEDEVTAQQQARQLIQKAQIELQDEAMKRKVIEFIETILLYKFPQLSRQEIEAMFDLSELKQTRYFQDVKEESKLEGKLETVPRFLHLGLSLEQIAAALELDIEMVRQASGRQSDS